MKYDLKGNIRSNKAFHIYLFSSNNSSLKPTLPLMLPQIQLCARVSARFTLNGRKAVPYLLFECGESPPETEIKIMYDINSMFNEATFMLWRGCAI